MAKDMIRRGGVEMVRIGDMRVALALDDYLETEWIKEKILALKVEIVGEAADGQDAIEMVERLKPDVLFIDEELSDMDGWEAASRIQKKRKIPVVILSREEGHEISSGFEPEGVLTRIKSPASTKDLERVMRLVAGKKKCPSLLGQRSINRDIVEEERRKIAEVTNEMKEKVELIDSFLTSLLEKRFDRFDQIL